MKKKSTGFKPIYNLMNAGYIPLILNGIIDSGLFDELGKEALSPCELSRKINADPSVLEGVIGLLKALGLVTDKGGKISITGMGKTFFTDSSPLNQIPEIRSFLKKPGPFDDFSLKLKKGPKRFDSSVFASKEVILGIEQRTIGGQLGEVVDFVSSLPGFDSFKTMCDFGGSSGYYSLGLQNKNPCLKSIVVDTPEVASLAREMKSENENSNRLEFKGLDMEACVDFGSNYDLFFVSHFLYHMQVNGFLSFFLKKVNRSMKKGGYFVSNHTGMDVEKEDLITQWIIELIARVQGYPTLNLDVSMLKSELLMNGFGDFGIRPANEGSYLNNVLVSAKKIKEV